MLRCPVCSDLLARRSVNAIQIDGCITCGGLWLDKGELQQLARDPRLLQRAGECFAPQRPALEAKRSNECPACGQPLSPFEFDRFRGVRLDRCKACGGVWLDHGEAAEIARRLQADAHQAQAFPPAAAPVTSAMAAAIPAAGPAAVPAARSAVIPAAGPAAIPAAGPAAVHAAGPAVIPAAGPAAVPAAVPATVPAVGPVSTPATVPAPLFPPANEWAAAPHFPQPIHPAPGAFAPPVAPQRFAPLAAEPSSGLELAYDPYSNRGPPPGESEPLHVPDEPCFVPPPPYPAQPNPAQFGLDRRELPLGKIILGALVLLLVAWWAWPVKLAEVDLKPVAANALSDPCEGKERCVVVVVAPWCPACKKAVPIINSMQERFKDSPRVGIKPVVAYDTESKLLDMARKISGRVYLDPPGTLMKEMGDRGVPYWYVVNDSGNVVESMAGVITVVQAQIEKLGLADY
ncbi:MAG: zf-TFIIB domain-containing protein [Myxococcales bacterium]